MRPGLHRLRACAVLLKAGIFATYDARVGSKSTSKHRRLMLNDQTFAKVNDFDLRDWINIARNQVAGETECSVRKCL